MEFAAKQVSISEEYGAIVLGFADDIDAPSQYILLERAAVPDAQDQQLGLDRTRIEINDQSRSVYCDFEKVILSQDRLSLSLTKEAAKQLDTGEAIDIRLPPGRSEFSDIVAACKKIFEEGCFQLRDEAR